MIWLKIRISYFKIIKFFRVPWEKFNLNHLIRIFLYSNHKENFLGQYFFFFNNLQYVSIYADKAWE